MQTPLGVIPGPQRDIAQTVPGAMSGVAWVYVCPMMYAQVLDLLKMPGTPVEEVRWGLQARQVRRSPMIEPPGVLQNLA